MLRLLILTFLLPTAADFPTPPLQTAVQKAVIAGKIAIAKRASEAATAHVEGVFDSATFRRGLRTCCPQSAELASSELLSLLRAEIYTAELAHTFPSGFGKSHFSDITIPLASKYNWFLNEWQAPIITNGTPATAYNLAEENIFGCPRFANDSQPTWTEAADRMIYIAHNLRQLDTGSLPSFGDVAAIFRKSYVKDMVLVAAVDTGMFEMACNKTAYPNSSKVPMHMHLDCSAWEPPVLGTLEHTDHIILANLATWSRHFNNTIEEQAVNLFSRSAFAGDYLNISNTTMMESLTYYEANILGNPRLPEGISFLIGNFYTLFGTDAGRELQQLADHYSWPLVWGLGAGTSGTEDESNTKANALPHLGGFPTESFPGNQRILDPAVLGSQALNATVATQAKDAFVNVWTQVANRKKNPSPIRPSEWLSWWSALTSKQARLAPLTARAGCSEDLCIGTMALSGECVCKHAAFITI